KMHISLAHQGEWAAVILHPRKSVGIDLETPSPKIDRIAPRLFSEKELHWADTPERRCMIWCAKEALYKWYGKRGLFFKEDLQIARFSLQNPLEAEVKGTAVQINTRRLQETQAVFCLAV
ncbi:MAG: 4'-phosphopantetheinyl transferase superfamily protein, partial [Bacteroidota bacterium]